MFQGKTVIVTGASRGIGKEIALTFARQGANLVLNYNNSATQIEEVAEEAKAFGSKVIVVQANVSKSEEASKLIAQAIESFGKIDILVNNAGITKDNLIMRMTDAEFDDVIDVNLKGTFYCMKYVSKYMMKQRSGRIINISSIVGVLGNPGQANYAASKAGIIGITKSIAKELASRGVTVNAVAPGFIETDMTKVLPEKVVEANMAQIPMKRPGTPSDIANAVSFLASDASSYITGQVLHVNGGMF